MIPESEISERLTSLQRFVNRSRVKPTEGQIEHATQTIAAIRAALQESQSTIYDHLSTIAQREHELAQLAAERQRLIDQWRGKSVLPLMSIPCARIYEDCADDLAQVGTPGAPTA